MKIYEIDEELRKLFEGVTNAMGDVDDVIINRINDLVMEKDAKLLALAKYIKEQKAEVIAMKGAEKDIATRRKRIEKRVESASEYILEVMDNKISDSCISVSKRKSEVVVIDEDTVSGNIEFVNEKVVRTIDKVGLKAAMKGGEHFGGVRLEERYSLQIK